MFTDNTVAERAFFRGTSRSRTLFDLVLRLRQLEMRTNSRLHVVHVAGTRMIAQGTDGLSRGDFSGGVMAGGDFLSHVPLHLSPLEREKGIRNWTNEWAVGSKGQPAIWLEPEDWFRPMKGGETYVWAVAPAAARCALNQLNQAILKRPNSVHLFFCPRLMTALWRKVLHKASDVAFLIPPQTPLRGSVFSPFFLYTL